MAGILIRPLTARSWLLWLLLGLLAREATAASTGGASSDRVLVLASYYPGHFWQQAEVDAVLITDLSMPHINGLLLAEKVLSLNPTQRIILASGLAETIGSELVRSKGIADVLPKPYGLAGLSSVVARVLSLPGGGRSV